MFPQSVCLFLFLIEEETEFCGVISPLKSDFIPAFVFIMFSSHQEKMEVSLSVCVVWACVCVSVCVFVCLCVWY